MKAIFLGLLASFFFAFTFVLNRAMDLSGGSWIWSSSLRFIMMVPFLYLIVFFRGNSNQVFAHIREQPYKWLIWSFVGFGLFYAPLTFAASFGPGWLIAGTWQITIVAGSLLIPFIGKKSNNDLNQKFPLRSIGFSLVILTGVTIMQAQYSEDVPLSIILLSIIPIVIAAFAYPLGNRKMMMICGDDLDTFQRVFGMTLASLPLWLLLALYGFITEGAPSMEQTIQTFIVALSSGVIATVLFFIATNMVRNDAQKLAAVEATQSGAVIFSVIGEITFLSGHIPSLWSLIGILLVIMGMILHSLLSKKNDKRMTLNKQVSKTN